MIIQWVSKYSENKIFISCKNVIKMEFLCWNYPKELICTITERSGYHVFSSHGTWSRTIRTEQGEETCLPYVWRVQKVHSLPFCTLDRIIHGAFSWEWVVEKCFWLMLTHASSRFLCVFMCVCLSLCVLMCKSMYVLMWCLHVGVFCLLHLPEHDSA